jgi:hypothetical protein
VQSTDLFAPEGQALELFDSLNEERGVPCARISGLVRACEALERIFPRRLQKAIPCPLGFAFR